MISAMWSGIFRESRKLALGTVFPLVLVFMLSLFGSTTSEAAPSGPTPTPTPSASSTTTSDNMTMSLLGWNILGLDSNNQTVGPNHYPLGARVCNTSSAPITPAINWVWGDAVATYITLASGATQYAREIPAAVSGTPTCADFWWEVGVERTSAAFNQTRPYSITAALPGENLQSVARTLKVERLVSQNRNVITSITGPAQVELGQTATFVMIGSTSTSYDQLTAWPKVDMNKFQIQSINFTYDTPAGQPAVDQFYKDACGWDYATYSCIGSGGAGGNLVVTIVVKAIEVGAVIFSGTIYDKSGSSYHYNGDFSANFTIAVGADAIDDSITTAYATAVSGNAATNDRFPADSSFTKSTNPANGSVDFNADGTYTYTPNSGFSGIDSFTYSICLPAPDATVCDTATVSIVVGPHAVNDVKAAAYETPVSGSVTANDTYATSSTFAKSSDPAHGSVMVNADGSYTYTPASGYSGDDTFDYTVCLPSPNTSMCSEATVTVTVAAPAVAPVATDDAKSVNFNTATGGDVKGNDTYPVGATFEKTSDPTHGSLTFNVDGTYTYTPSTNYVGKDSFTYKVCLAAPDQGTCSTATVTITVGPNALDDAETTLFETAVESDVADNDTFVTNSVFSKLRDPAHGSVTLNTDGTYSYTPNTGFTGIDSFDYEVCLPAPDSAICASATVDIVVGPKAIDDSKTTAFETEATGDVTGNDTYPVGSVFEKVSDPAHGVVTVNADGTYSYMPATGFSGSDSFDYKVCMPSPNATVCSTATVTVVVGPDAADDSESTPFETEVDGDVTGNDSYATASAFAKVSEPSHGLVVFNADGTYTYTPNTGFTGTDSFDYEVCLPAPNATLCSTATVTIVVGPKAVADATTTAFETAVNGDVTGNDTSPEGSTFEKVSDPSHGSVTLGSDGTYTYTPATGFSGTDSFDYKVCMPSPNATVCSTATVTIVVGPDASADSTMTPRDTPVDGDVSDNDVFPAGSTFAKLSDPAHGSVTVNADGTYTYTPDSGFSGNDSFTYEVCMPAPDTTLCSSATVTISVGLKASDDVNTGPYGGPVNGDVTPNDLYPDGATFTKVTEPSNGSVIFNADGTYTYTPNSGFIGTDSFDYEICLPDPDSTVCSIATVTITVSPDAGDDSETTAFETDVEGDVIGNDTYPAGSTFEKVTDPANGSVTFNSDGTYTYTPSTGFTGIDQFDYKVCLPSPNETVCVTATVTIVVGPDAADDSVTTAYETDVAGDVTGNDTYLDSATFEKVSDPANGSVAFNSAGTFTYTPNAGFSGSDSFDYKVCLAKPNDALCSTATVTIVVGPDAVDDSATTAFETDVEGDVTGNDTYPVGSTFEKVTDPANGSVTFNADGTYTYTPSTGFTGIDQFDYKVCLAKPDDAICSTATVTIVVGPNAVDDAVTTPYGQFKIILFTANDTYPVPGPIFEQLTSPTHGSVQFKGTHFRYDPDAGFTGTDSFNYQVCMPIPNETVCATASVTIVVGPDAVADSEVTAFETDLEGDVAGNDTYLDGANFEKVTDPANGSVVFNSDGTYTYTPSTGFTGTDSFDYQVCHPAPDADVCATATVTIVVGPDAGDDSETTAFETDVVGDVTGNDTYLDGATFEKVTDPANGSVTFNVDGTYTYTPGSGFSGTDSFDYKVCLPEPDATVCTTATVTIVVGPDAADDAEITAFNTDLNGDVTVNDAYPKESSFEKLSDPSHGSVVFNTDGTYTYTPSLDYVGEDSFTYSVCLPSPHEAICSSATVTIIVDPLAVDDSEVTDFETPVSGDVTGNDTYPAGATFEKVTEPTNGSVTVNADGTYTYTPDSDFAGTDSFEYKVCLPDPESTVCSTATVTIVVGPQAHDTTEGGTPDSPLDGDLSDGSTFPPGSTFEKVTDPTNGTVTIDPDGKYTYTPDEGFTGTDTFTYKVCLPVPNQSVCSTGTVTISVEPTPVTPPKATSDKKATPIDTPVVGDVSSNDDFPPGSIFKKFGNPSHGFLRMNANGTYTYTPNAGFSGTDTFKYMACLPAPRQNECTVATVTITVGDGSSTELGVLPNTGAGELARLGVWALVALCAGFVLIGSALRRRS